MRIKTVLFEKKMKDYRFRKNEETIIKVYRAEYKNEITTKKLAKEAGVCRATMYFHHRSTKEILPDYRKYLLVQYSRGLKSKINKENILIKTLFLDVLLFIVKNKNIFEMFLQFGDKSVLEKMLWKLKPRIVDFTGISEQSDKSFRIFVSEAIEIIVEWGEKGFSEMEIERVLGDIMYLAKTAKTRLAPISS